MKIYILVNDVVDDRYNLGVFTSKRKAETAKKTLLQNKKWYRSGDLSVEVWENGEHKEKEDF